MYTFVTYQVFSNTWKVKLKHKKEKNYIQYILEGYYKYRYLSTNT